MKKIDKETIERIKMLDSKIKEILIECKESYGIDDYDILDISCVDDHDHPNPGENLRFSEDIFNFEVSDCYSIIEVSLWEDGVEYCIMEDHVVCGYSQYANFPILNVDQILEDDKYTKNASWFDLEKVLLNILNMVSNDGHFDDDFCRTHRCIDV